MSRHTRRVSRLLIATLLITFSAAALSFIYKMNHPVAAAASPSATPSNASSSNISAPVASGDATSAVSKVPSTQPFPELSPTPPMIDPPPHAVEAAEYLPGPATEPSASASSVLLAAQRKIDAGRLLDAREDLNNTLQSAQLDASQITSVKGLLAEISQTVLFGHQRFADDSYGGTYVVQPGDSLAKIARAHDCTWELIGRINGIDPKHLRAGATIKVVQGPFFAVVQKHDFTMDIYLGGLPGEKSSMYVTSYKVGLGKDDSTPIGTWMVEPHRKLKHPTYYSPRGEGIIPADDPKNPLGGYWIGLTGTEGQAIGKLSYGIHGTIDPDSIGKQSSLGCIRLRSDDIAVVYDMLVEGKSMVVVKD